MEQNLTAVVDARDLPRARTEENFLNTRQKFEILLRNHANIIVVRSIKDDDVKPISELWRSEAASVSKRANGLARDSSK